MEDWRPEAEAVHDISLQVLEENGHSADAVAAWFLQETDNAILVSDAPGYDGFWLKRLLEGRADVSEILHFNDVAHAAFSSEGSVAPGRLHFVYKNMSSRRVTHRAEDDARHLALGFRAGLPKR